MSNIININEANNKPDVESINRRAAYKVRNDPEPKSQKFSIGTRVRIDDDLGDFMQYFPKGKNATVLYTYAHAFMDISVSDNLKAYTGLESDSYALDVDGVGFISWYRENQLTAIEEKKCQ